MMRRCWYVAQLRCWPCFISVCGGTDARHPADSSTHGFERAEQSMVRRAQHHGCNLRRRKIRAPYALRRNQSLLSLEWREQSRTTSRRAQQRLSGRILRAGRHGAARPARKRARMFLPGADSPQLSSLPQDSVMGCSADGSEIVYYVPSNPDRQIFVGPVKGPFKTFGVTGRITATAFSPDGNMLYLLLFQPSGESSLIRISVHELHSKTIAHDLDASPGGNTIAISADGSSAYIALASAGAPNNAARHKPDSDRWLAIYKIDLTTGARSPVVATPGVDNHNPAIAGGSFFWARNAIRDSIAVVPVERWRFQGCDRRRGSADLESRREKDFVHLRRLASCGLGARP